MYIIKTQGGNLINMDHIERIRIIEDILVAETPSYSELRHIDTHVLYEDNNREHLEKARDCLFESLTNRSSGFDFSVPAKWEGEQNG